MIREKSLLMSWTDLGHNAMIIPTRMENYFGSSALFYSEGTKWPRALKRGEDIFKP
jgi:hypothetical protein